MSAASKKGLEACDKELQHFITAMKEPFQLMSTQEIQNHRAKISDKPESVLEEYKEYGEMTHKLMEVKHEQGNPFNLSIFTPKRSPPSGGRPCLYFIHGGGFVTNNQCSGIASIFPCIHSLNAVCVSVDYSLAPGSSATSATTRLEQCYTGLLEFCKSKEGSNEINFEKLAIIGRSAGAALLVGMNLKLLEQTQVKIKCNVMSFPMLDDECSGDSHSDFCDAPHLTSGFAKYCWDQHLTNSERDKYLVPIKATTADLQGFPPTLVEVALADVLRDDGRIFSKKLVEAEVKEYKGFHCFDGQGKDTNIGRDAMQNRKEYLEKHLLGITS